MPRLSRGLSESDTVGLNAAGLTAHAVIENLRRNNRARVGVRLRLALLLLLIVFIFAFLIGLYVGYEPLSFAALKSDPIARAVFLRLRLPRVVMAGVFGASPPLVGAAPPTLFLN